MTIDAIVRSIVRMTVTHERLLEWETAAEAESNYGKKTPVETYLQLTPWIAFLVGVIVALERPASFMIALPMLVLWGLRSRFNSGSICRFASRTRRSKPKTRSLLRHSALRTWRLFREYSTAEENFMIPDTIMKPDSLIVHRISTTNLGLLLNSRLAAMDLGFLTLPEFLTDTERSFDSIDKMPRHEGQMYNWYDNRTLDAVKPRFISAVDNGNLVCALWTVKQGCLGAIREPLFRPETLQGLRDHLDTIEEIFKSENQEESLLAGVREMKQKIGTLSDSPATWIDALAGCERVTVALAKKLSTEPIETEAQWWVYELRLRISHLESLVYDFAPWLQPQFAKCTAEPGVLGTGAGREADARSSAEDLPHARSEIVADVRRRRLERRIALGVAVAALGSWPHEQHREEHDDSAGTRCRARRRTGEEHGLQFLLRREEEADVHRL